MNRSLCLGSTFPSVLCEATVSGKWQAVNSHSRVIYRHHCTDHQIRFGDSSNSSDLRSQSERIGIAKSEVQK